MLILSVTIWYPAERENDFQENRKYLIYNYWPLEYIFAFLYKVDSLNLDKHLKFLIWMISEQILSNK